MSTLGTDAGRALLRPLTGGTTVVLPHMVHILAEWAVQALERPCTPYEMYCWVAERVMDLPPRNQPAFHILEDWCLACCA